MRNTINDFRNGFICSFLLHEKKSFFDFFGSFARFGLECWVFYPVCKCWYYWCCSRSIDFFDFILKFAFNVNYYWNIMSDNWNCRYNVNNHDMISVYMSYCCDMNRINSWKRDYFIDYILTSGSFFSWYRICFCALMVLHKWLDTIFVNKWIWTNELIN